MIESVTNTVNCALRLKASREKLNLNQKSFAKRLGITNSYISEMESGGKNITSNVLAKLAEVFDISPNWILLGEGGMFLKEEQGAIPEGERELKQLNWYCLNSPFVKHSLLSYFIRLIRKDKTIIENDIKINRSPVETG